MNALRAGLAGLVLAVALPAPFAHATPFFHYRGGCGTAVVNDTTPGGSLGGPNQWNGEIDIIAVATNEALGTPAPTAAIDVTCRLQINFVDQGTVLRASGLGVAVNVAQFSFTAEADDVVELCETVSVQGDDHPEVCYWLTHSEHPPGPIFSVLDTLDTIVCLAFSALAPGVPGVLDITPQGDVYLLGTQVWDCPPQPSDDPALLPVHMLEEHHF